MSDPEVVKVGRTGRDLGELNVVEELNPRGNKEWTDQLQTVCLWVGPGVLHHIPIPHPIGDNAKTPGIRRDRNSQQWQDIGVR